MARHFASLTAESAVERGLAATGLGFGEVDVAAGALQNFGHRHADFGKKLVDDAGDKQRDPKGHES